jgi:superfamily I DNA/RNA helicase
MPSTWSIPVEAGRKPLAGTPQQEDFWDAVLHGDRNILLKALAGTGKSTSCREAMWRVLERDPDIRIRYACFNKAIAQEFKARSPRQADVATLHSFGMKAILKARPGVQVEGNRTWMILDALRVGRFANKSLKRAVVQLVSLAKNHCVVPEGVAVEYHLKQLLDHFDINTWGRSQEVVDLAIEVLLEAQLGQNVIDFDDMLWLPVLENFEFPRIDLLFIDEAQDLNPVQHALVSLMADSGRTIVVGDPNQAIYAFRGADSDSIPTLQRQLDALTLPLTVTFRCPRTHVELARQIVPDFEAAPEAPEGTLANGSLQDLASLEPGDLVLCRANAPLVAHCLELFRQRRRATMRGRAFGDQLTTLYRRIEPDCPTVGAFQVALQRWKAQELTRLEDRDGTEDLVESAKDKADCLMAISDTCTDLVEIPEAIQSLFDDQADPSTRVTFSTVHRAKGSEARRVTFLDKPYTDGKRRKPVPDWEYQQRRNLRYVALTRSLDTLNIIPTVG